MVNSMQDNILVVDVGNTSIKWALSSLDGLSEMMQQRYPEKDVSQFFKQCWQELEKPSEIMISCVAHESVWNALEQACFELWGFKVNKVVSMKKGYGLTNAYTEVETLGSDRWCAMIGAIQSADIEAKESGFIVISAGSALTIDVVNEFGVHLGGYIVPGLAMMQKSLGLETAQVQTDDFDKNAPSLLLANSTNKCVEAGIHLSAVKLIESVLAKETNYQCFLTGGDANLIANLLPFKCVIIHELVLVGLARIALEK